MTQIFVASARFALVLGNIAQKGDLLVFLATYIFVNSSIFW